MGLYMDETVEQPKVEEPKIKVSIANPIKDYEETDVFAWANNLFEYKEDLQFDIFLINKNGVLYRAKLDKKLDTQLQPLLIDGVLEAVLDGAETGMVVRGFEDAESEENVLQRTQVFRIEKLVEAMNWLKTQEHEIEIFKEEEHDIRRIKGMLVRCHHPDMKQPFYIAKALPTAQIMKGLGAWMARTGSFIPYEAPGIRIPNDNQMLILDQDVYVFNQAKLERLFGYNAKKASIAEKKVAAIESQFKLSFADGLDMQSAIKGNKTAINKLQNLELDENMKQEDLIDHAEELGIELMVDEEGAIIILNSRDLTTFVNLLNDDYVESNLTGNRYEIRSKRLLKLSESDA